jgi:hypothetical protein
MALSLKVLAAAIVALGVASLVCLGSRSESPQPLLNDTQPTEGVSSSPSATPAEAPAVVQATNSAAAPPPQPILPPQSNEDSLADSMHRLESTDPAAALELARQGQRRWPDGPRAAEFAAIEVKCLYLLGKPSEGRGAAEAMVNKYRNSTWAFEVERQTGAHPYVNH